MNIGRTVYCKSIVLRQLLTPLLLITVDGPVITVESTPENCFSVPIKELLRDNTAIIGFNVHNTDSIIVLSANRNGVTSYD